MNMSNGVMKNGIQDKPIKEEKNRRKGSDPLISTARGKLQSRRSKLNDQINRELRMRNGAENLFRATGNKRLKELVAVELSFFNSNIQLLKEELSDLNSAVVIYQHENCANNVPMIPLGLKETTDCDIAVSIKLRKRTVDEIMITDKRQILPDHLTEASIVASTGQAFPKLEKIKI